MIDQVLISLDIMWKGMFSIFLVITMITLLIIAFQWYERNVLDKEDKK